MSWGNLEPRDFAIPTINVGQAMSKSGKPGFFNFSTGESVEKLKSMTLVIPIKRRVLFGKVGADETLCWSDDYVKPSPKVENPVNSNCITCPLSKWANDIGFDDSKIRDEWAKKINKSGNNPLCSSSMNLYLMTQEGSPCILSLQGTNFTAVKNKLFPQLQKISSKEPYYATFDVILVKKHFDAGDAYNVEFENFNVSPKETLEKAIELEMSLSQTRLDRQIEATPVKQVTHERTVVVDQVDDGEIPLPDETPTGKPIDTDDLPF